MARGTGLAAGDLVSIDPDAVFKGRGNFAVTGYAASPSGVSSVTISAVIDGGETRVLGRAAVAADGSYTFRDHVGAHLQGFVIATLTDDLGGTTDVQSPYSLQAGLHGSYVAEQDRYTPDGNEQVSSTYHHSDGSRVVDVMAAGQTFSDNYFDTFHNGGAPDTTFVFHPGHGLDTITGFRVGGADHDSIDLQASGSTTLADVLRHTQNVPGGVLITGPTTDDTIKLTGVTKAELRANPSVFILHP